MINYIALLVALSVSAVSGFYSIVGLATIFAAAYWPVVSMGIVLELGKLTTASWLYRNWKYCSKWLKYYLTASVFILMFISSMGIFGFLSKAHIEQSINLNTGNSDQIKILETDIKTNNDVIKDYDKQIEQIDSAIASIGSVKGKGNDSLKAADQQRKNRDILVKNKNDKIADNARLTKEKIKLDSEVRKMEAEVGPLKYIADLIYEKADGDQLEKAVRLVIIILIFVFDPLAVLLLIAANDGLSRTKPKKIGRPMGSKNKNTVEIDRNNIKVI